MSSIMVWSMGFPNHILISGLPTLRWGPRNEKENEIYTVTKKLISRINRLLNILGG